MIHPLILVSKHPLSFIIGCKISSADHLLAKLNLQCSTATCNTDLDLSSSAIKGKCHFILLAIQEQELVISRSCGLLGQQCLT